MSAPLGFQSLFELDINPGGTENYKRLGDGMTSASPALNETVDEKSYLSDNGGRTKNVTGFGYDMAFSGDRIPGDPVQDFILARMFSLGGMRKTKYRQTDADGATLTGDCTITIDTPPGGDANAVQAFAFTIGINGQPVRTAPVAATAPTATFAAGTAVGTTKATVTPAVGNSLFIRLTAAQLTANGRQFQDIGELTAYTSGNDIAATAGQYLSVYELDEYRHVVKFVSHLVATGELKAA